MEGKKMVYSRKIKIVVKWSSIIRWQAANEGKVPEVPGVYELLVKQKDDKYARRYVGQGEDLRERFQAHLSPKEENECIRERLAKYACGFDYAVIADRDERVDAERALYDKYRSQLHCNQVPPPGSGKGYDVEIVEE